MTYETKIRRYYSSIGKCPYCHGKNELFGDEKMCPECRAKKWIYKQNYKKEHPDYIVKDREATRKRRNERAENHQCVYCGEPLTDFNFKMCKKCRVRNMLRVRSCRQKSTV